MKLYIHASRSTKPYHIVMRECPQQVEGHADTLDEAIKIADKVHRRYEKIGAKVTKVSVVKENAEGGYDYLYTTQGDI